MATVPDCGLEVCEFEHWSCHYVYFWTNTLRKGCKNIRGGVLPLMAVVQPTKNKVRPVLDFRELNKYVACHTKDGIDICEEVMREWRRMERATKIVDLKSA